MTETLYLSKQCTQLQKAKETPQNKVPKIQKVAHYLRDRKDFTKHYSPRLVSIGPIHYGEQNLKLGEKYKHMWAAKYLERNKLDAHTLYQKIVSNIKDLRERFSEDVIRKFPDDENLSWMLFVDGCSLLQILEKGNLNDPKEMNVKVDQLVLAWQDVLLLENQLPYHVLKLLSRHQNDAELVKSMNEFLNFHHLSPVREGEREKIHDKGKSKNKDEDRTLAEDGYSSVYVTNEDTLQGEHTIEIGKELPFHLLDQLRRYVLDDPQKFPQHQKANPENEERDQKTNKEDLDMTTYRNIEELRAAGIKLKVEKSRRLTDISFSYRWMCLRAELTLPEITVDDTTATTFHNLIAYEMCPDFENTFEICSFVAFMDSLIDHPEDVKELRSAKVLHNALGSDEEVANLFNTISSDLVPNTESYSLVRRKIEKHYRNKYWSWITLGYHSYFSNPWAIIAFHAAFVALVLTFIQTWFTINPRNPC